MAALGEREEGRKERTKSLPRPLDRTAQRQWRNLTEEVEKTKEKKKETFSQDSGMLGFKP
jgi:hypothetical protein